MVFNWCHKNNAFFSFQVSTLTVFNFFLISTIVQQDMLNLKEDEKNDARFLNVLIISTSLERKNYSFNFVYPNPPINEWTKTYAAFILCTIFFVMPELGRQRRWLIYGTFQLSVRQQMSSPQPLPLHNCNYTGSFFTFYWLNTINKWICWRLQWWLILDLKISHVIWQMSRDLSAQDATTDSTSPAQ